MRRGKRINPSHYHTGNPYNSPFGIGYAGYGNLGLGNGAHSQQLMQYALIGAAGGAAYSLATKKMPVTESSVYGAIIGAVLSMLMPKQQAAAPVATTEYAVPQGGVVNFDPPTSEEISAAVDLTADSPGSCPDGMILMPANDGTGQMVCVPISTGVPEISWEPAPDFADPATSIGPIISLNDPQPLYIGDRDFGPVIRKVNSNGGSGPSGGDPGVMYI